MLSPPRPSVSFKSGDKQRSSLKVRTVQRFAADFPGRCRRDRSSDNRSCPDASRGAQPHVQTGLRNRACAFPGFSRRHGCCDHQAPFPRLGWKQNLRRHAVLAEEVNGCLAAEDVPDLPLPKPLLSQDPSCLRPRPRRKPKSEIHPEAACSGSDSVSP